MSDLSGAFAASVLIDCRFYSHFSYGASVISPGIPCALRLARILRQALSSFDPGNGPAQEHRSNGQLAATLASRDMISAQF